MFGAALARGRGPAFIGGRRVSRQSVTVPTGLVGCSSRAFQARVWMSWERSYGRPFASTTRCHQQQVPEQPSIPSIFSSSSWESSDWAIHVVVSSEDAPMKTLDAIQRALQAHYSSNDTDVLTENQYTAEELLKLGSAWYLPKVDMKNRYKRPSRLVWDQACFMLEEGDYMRIHFDPRRFKAVELYDWSVSADSKDDTKQKVLLDMNPSKGYLILNKPSECIPVHPTVDNSAENIAACLRQANPDLEYVTTPHRLDQNTSGLLTVATSKAFAAYYAQGLRIKTAAQVANPDESESNEPSPTDAKGDTSKKTGIHKVYRCLVCLMPPAEKDDSASNWSVDKALRDLQTSAKEAKVLRHYLEPSMRAPKRFFSDLPLDATLTTNTDKTRSAGWAECLMRILRVGDVCALRGNVASETLAKTLWSSPEELMPPSCQAVVELEVELLTGRTHQIRGQLSADGYPLVNDLPYGGAIVGPGNVSHQSNYRSRLALQCCRLDFLDPDVKTVEKKKKGHINVITKMVPSERWNKYQLDSAWWTPCLEGYKEALKKTSEEEMTTMAAVDIGLMDSRPREKPRETTTAELLPKGLPPQAMLSPGRNKYVIVKATDPNTGEIYKWFVKSGSASECGPYHKDVAKDLVEWIEACGYRAVVTGGGRILYHDDTKRALVYGFSYGFGRGDHVKAAKVIKEWSEGTIDAAYDDSADLY